MSENKKRFNFHARDLQLISMAGLSVIFLAVFAYLPMCGILLAFKNGNKVLDLFNALFEPGLTTANFTELFKDKEFWETFINTLRINILMLVFNFPMPIIFALLINEVKCKAFKKSIQTLCNFPHFISWVVYGGIVLALTDANLGIVNPILEVLGLSSKENPIDLNLAQYFYPKIIFVTIVKGVGWGSIIYLAAIAGIDPTLYEAAMIDGAGRFRQAINITLPLIKSTIIIFLLLNLSGLLGNNFEQFYIFQSTINLSRTQVLATYSYNLAFTYRRYATATALSLFEGIISVILLLSSNYASKKITGEGIF